MSELSEFVRGLNSDPLVASKTLITRAEKYVTEVGAYASRADERIADMMSDAMLPLLIAAELLTDKQVSESKSKGTSRLRELVAVARSALRIRESEADSEAALASVEKLLASAQAKKNEPSFGFAFLDATEKGEIHERLNAIRQVIETSDLAVRKKNALLNRVNLLAKEVDAVGTSTDRFFSFMGDLAYTAGEMATKAKPAIDEAKEMLRIVVNARARDEGVELPKPKDWPLLPSSNDKPNNE